MGVSRGKDFEDIIKRCVLEVPDVSLDRFYDSTNGFLGVATISDFVCYRAPYEYYFECKSHYGNTLPFSCITDNQWNGMLNKIDVVGVHAGVICWFIDHDITLYIPISTLQSMKIRGKKSFNVKDAYTEICYLIPGKKKRVFFEYDFKDFFDTVQGVKWKNVYQELPLV